MISAIVCFICILFGQIVGRLSSFRLRRGKNLTGSTLRHGLRSSADHVAVYEVLVAALTVGERVHVLKLADIVCGQPAVLTRGGVACHPCGKIASQKTVNIEL